MKNGWKICTNKTLIEMCKEVAGFCKCEFGLSGVTDVKVYTHRSYRALGTCYSRSNEIVLSDIYNKHPQYALNTICHEYAHYVADHYYGENCHHNYRWKKVANIIGKSFGEVIERVADSKDPILEYLREEKAKNRKIKSTKSHRVTHPHNFTYKYKVNCNGCGYEWKFKKKCSWFGDVRVAQSYTVIDTAKCPFCKTKSFRVTNI